MKHRYTLESHKEVRGYIRSRIMTLRGEIKRGLLEPEEIVEITNELEKLENKLKEIDND